MPFATKPGACEAQGPSSWPRIWGLFVGLLLMLAGTRLVALDPTAALSQARVAFWKDGSGLPQNFVNVIHQTRDGYLWIGTKGGLARFDGVRFETYDDLHGDQLKEAEVWAFAEAPDGSVWIGTYGGGLSHLVDGRFETLTTSDGLPGNQIEHLLQDPGGKLWIATLGGLASRDPDGKITSFGVADGLPAKAVFALHLDEEGTLWIGTAGGLASYREGRFTNHAALHPPELARPVSAIAGSFADGLWLGFSSFGGQAFGLGRYGAEGVSRFTTREGLPSDLVTSLAMDSHGALWIGTLGGLGRYKSGRFETGDATGATASLLRVEALFVDREDNLWVGTRADGIARLSDSQFRSVTAGLASDFDSVLEDRQGGMWIGSEVGLRRLVGSRVESYSLPSGFTAGCLAEDHAGVVWIGTQQGLFKVQAGVLSRVTLGALDQLPVSALFVDQSGSLWIGARQGGLFELRGGKLRQLGAAEGLPGEQIRAITQDAKGALWVGTRDGGLTIFREGGARTIDTREGLASPTAQSIWVDADGVGWVSTRKGLARIRDGQVAMITTTHGLPANFFYQIIEDDSNHLWLTHSRGVARVARAELNEVADSTAARVNATSFGTDSGLCSTTMTVSIQSAVWKRRNGELWFATARCVAVIDPRSLVTRTDVPPAHIERVTVDGRMETARDGLSFSPGRGDAEIRYTGISFASPESMVFRYRLESIGQGWVDAGTRRVAFFTGLPPGRHRFEVLACHAGGKCEGKSARISFEILPHFYETWPFRATVAAMVLAMGFGGIRWRLAAARSTLARVTRELAERTEAERVLRSLNTELRLALESGRMGTWFWSADTGRLSWSGEVDRITNGLTVGLQADLAGFVPHVHVEDRALFARSLVEADASAQSAHRFEVRLVLPGGEVRWFEFRGQSLEDATGRVGVVGTVADVDDRRRSERDREALLEVLEQRNAELERFTFSVSHDLKSPLVTIRGFLGLLLEDLAAGRTERVADDAGRIVDATSRMQRLLDELLDLSRVGLQRSSPEPFSARHAVDEAISAVQGRIDEARARVEIEPDLPMLYGDRQRIVQVLQNLIDNAASFMAGQPSPRIVIGARSGGGWPVITVKDNGIGIDPKYAERVFDLFEKLDPRSGGTGVGLALVRRIVQHHGGEVWVESAGEGSGSTFCFTLPPRT